MRAATTKDSLVACLSSRVPNWRVDSRFARAKQSMASIGGGERQPRQRQSDPIVGEKRCERRRHLERG